jgi:hypothetical protein
MVEKTMTEDEQKEFLEVEAARGESYTRVYEETLKTFFDEKERTLFAAFKTVDANNLTELQKVKLQATAFDSLKAEFQSVIESGQMARQQLNLNLEKEKENGH